LIYRESEEQQALIYWARLAEKRYPELKLIFAIPNGGKRNVREATRLKKEGVSSGVPDLHIPVPKGRYNGLWIEMKVAKGKLSFNQSTWIKMLESWGHKVAVCYGWEEAKETIIKYLEG